MATKIKTTSASNSSSFSGSFLLGSSSSKLHKSCYILQENINSSNSFFTIGAASSHKMTPCNFTKCKVCPIVNANNTVKSYATNKDFGVVRNEYLTCQAENVIYVITCKNCGVQYVGETKRTLRTRINEHLNSIQKNKLGSYMVQHFNSTVCNIKHLEVTILEHCKKDTLTAERINREDFWIRALVTAFPFGLNDKIKGYGLISKGVNPLSHKNTPYFCMKFPSTKKFHGKRRRTNKNISIESINQALALYTDQSCNIKILFHKLFTLSKRNMKQMFNKIQSQNLETSYANRLCFEAVFDHRFSKKQKEVCNNSKIYLPVDFPNKAMDKIKLHTLFKDKRIRKLTQIPDKDLGDVIVAYKAPPAAGSLILNHGKFLRQLNLETLKKIISSDCNCANSDFKYDQCGHVYTGNVDIVQNIALRKIFSFGTKYRIPRKMNWNDVQDACRKGLIDFKQKLVKKFKLDMQKLDALEIKALELINKRIAFYKKLQFCCDKDSANVTDMRIFISEIKKLQDKYIIAPADKANNNYIFICKKYYLQVMCKEMGIELVQGINWEIKGNEVYKTVPAHSAADLIQSHQNYAEAEFNITIKNEDKTLPMIFAIPKLHKTPYKFRFIAGANKSSCKSVAILLARILSHFKEHFQNYCNVTEMRLGTPVYWSIENSQIAKEKLTRISKAVSIKTADFSTLYTILPHSIIIREIWYLADLLFKNEGKKYICVGFEKCFYSDSLVNRCKCLTKEDVIYLVEFILTNTFVTFAGEIFQQISGVPMGGNASPLLADLTLSCLEYKYLKSASTDKRYKMKYTTRYMDDLCNLNNNEFFQDCAYIYPASLTLEETTANTNYSNYLDMTFNITAEYKVKCSLYNKTDAFNFNVIRLPEASSNLPEQIGYNTFYSQLIRIARICDEKVDFDSRVTDLCEVILCKGFNARKIKCKMKKFAYNYNGLIIGLGYSVNSFLIAASNWLHL